MASVSRGNMIAVTTDGGVFQTHAVKEAGYPRAVTEVYPWAEYGMKCERRSIILGNQE